MNMFKPTGATTISEYKTQLSPDRKKTIDALDEIIKQTVPSLKPYFATNMLGYGKFKYTDYKKDVIDWPVIALASQKNYISLYVCAVNAGSYIAEEHQAELGKVSVGKSCIRFKKLEDINLDALKKVLKLAEKYPGLV